MKNLLDIWKLVMAGKGMLLLIGLASMLGIALSGEYLAGQRQAYEDAAGQAARCLQMAQRIMTSRGAAPAVNHPAATAIDDSATIASAISAVGIAPGSVDRIEHDGDVRIGSSPYVRRQTGISLKGVSLPRVVDLLATLDDAPVPLEPLSLRIVPANDVDHNDDELWDVAVSVASARYDPPAGRSTAARASADRSTFP